MAEMPVSQLVVQARADEKRYAILVNGGLATNPQRYEQAKAALDTAEAQLETAQAEAKVAENAASNSALVADADGRTRSLVVFSRAIMPTVNMTLPPFYCSLTTTLPLARPCSRYASASLA